MNLFELWATLGLDTSEFDSKIKGATQQGQTMADSFRRNYGTGSESVPSTVQRGMNAMSVFTGNILSDIARGGVMKLGEILTGSIDAASDLQEVQNVVDVTFGDSADTINQWSQEAKKAYGIGETAAKRYNGTMGAMLKSMGIADEDAVEMSTALTGLAGDMASFYNLDHEEAFNKIRSGISGETEPLKQLGINMSVANLEAFALAQGLEKAYDEMSEAEKVQLRYEYLMKATADAQGDFSRTSEGYANQSRLLAENIATLQTNIGEFLLPVVNEGITLINKLFAEPETDELTEKVNALKDNVDGISQGVKTANDNFAKTMTDVDARRALAKEYLEVIESLEGKEVLTPEEAAALQNASTALETMYGIEVTDEDNRLVKTHEELQQIIADLDAIAKRRALDDLLAEKEKAAAELAAQGLEAQAVLDDLTPKQQASNQKLQSLIDLQKYFQDNGFLSVPAMYGDAAAMLPNFGTYMQRGVDGSWSLKPNLIEMGIDPVSGIDSSLNQALTTQQAEVDAINEQVATAQASIDYTEAQIQVLKSESEALSTAYDSIISSSNSAKASADAAKPPVDALWDSINDLPDKKEIEITTLYKSVHSDEPGFATGLDYVPNDDFPARLHEGEAVLTKIEAEDWRRGKTAGGGNSGRVETLLLDLISAVKESAGASVVLDSGVLVGQLTPGINANLGAIARRRG